jgi:hypothetical protein
MTTAKWTINNNTREQSSRICTILLQDLMKRGVCGCGVEMLLVHQCFSVYHPAKIFFTSKFSYLLFCNPTHKTETGTINIRGTSNSKPPGPIIMIGQSETPSTSQIICTTHSFLPPWVHLKFIHFNNLEKVFTSKGKLQVYNLPQKNPNFEVMYMC